MAATISANSAGGGGLVSSGDASGVLALQTAGVTGLTIDASQKVTFANSLTSPTLVTPTLVTPTIDSAQVPTVSGTAPIYMCRAWIYFVGSIATPSIKGSGNISSITDNGTGDYTVNFTTAMPDANYSVSCSAGYSTSASFFTATSARSTATPTAPTTTQVAVQSYNGTAVADANNVFVAVFR